MPLTTQVSLTRARLPRSLAARTLSMCALAILALLILAFSCAPALAKEKEPPLEDIVAEFVGGPCMRGFCNDYFITSEGKIFLVLQCTPYVKSMSVCREWHTPDKAFGQEDDLFLHLGQQMVITPVKISPAEKNNPFRAVKASRVRRDRSPDAASHVWIKPGQIIIGTADCSGDDMLFNAADGRVFTLSDPWVHAGMGVMGISEPGSGWMGNILPGELSSFFCVENRGKQVTVEGDIFLKHSPMYLRVTDMLP